jgi:hypothetical protein
VIVGADCPHSQERPLTWRAASGMLIAANVKRRDIQRSAAIVHAKTIEQILTALDSTEKRHDDLAAYQQRMMRLRLISTVVVLLAYAGVLA